MLIQSKQQCLETGSVAGLQSGSAERDAMESRAGQVHRQAVLLVSCPSGLQPGQHFLPSQVIMPLWFGGTGVANH